MIYLQDNPLSQGVFICLQAALVKASFHEYIYSIQEKGF